MAPSSSSTKKAARLAKSGQGKKVRFQGGTLFPVIVAVVVVLGLALIVYSRQSRPAADASAPTIDDHWHMAYGFYLCDTWVQLTGNQEAQGSPGFNDYARTGIHSHDDGVIHWHPFTSASVGRNAKFSLFLDVYGIELSDSKLVFPEDQRAQLPVAFQEDGTFEEGETQCEVDGKMKDAELKVVVWNNFTDTDKGTTYIADFNNIRADQDAMAFTVAFVPPGTDVGMPPWSDELPELAGNDSGQVIPADPTATTIAGQPVAPSSTVAAAAPLGDDGTVTTEPVPGTDATSPATTGG